mgnify:FL=1|tara:strand:- start:298 stop:633 length:336 start_codon:yes stop_codon:yes gene_type:complete
MPSKEIAFAVSVPSRKLLAKSLFYCVRQQIINSHIETMNSKATAVQNELISMIKQDIDLNAIEIFSKNYNEIGHVFIPNEPVRLARIELENIRYITGTTAGTKLKNISKIQ